MARPSEAEPTVELWRARVRPLDPAFLPAGDRQRWEQFVLPADRDRLATAVRLRDHLLRAHGHPTRVTRWCPACGSDQHGGIRPPGDATWRLSVSHAEDLVVIAYADSAVVALGVDVEQVARFGPELAQYVLGPGESDRTPSALAETWTAKEAVLKAAGCGLQVSPIELTIRRSARKSGAARVGVLTRHPLLRPIRDLPGLLTDITTPLGLDPATWRAALFVLGATQVDLRVRTFTDPQAPGAPTAAAPPRPSPATNASHSRSGETPRD